MNTALPWLLAASLTGCVSVTSASINQIPPHALRKNVIKARASSPLIIGFHFGSGGYIDDARADLMAQCQGGAIEGVLAKHETTNYFLGIVELYTVDLQAYCVNHKGQKKA
jgi:hypothetical protein